MRDSLVPVSRHRKTTFRTLPTEIHIQIASYLPYPDALALKHTDRYFYSLVCTGVALKVGWVIDRSSRHLQVPGNSCEFRTYETFCRGEVKRIMEKRRWHMECKPHPGGCSVVEGASCGGGSPLRLLRKGQTGLLLKRMGISLDTHGKVPPAVVLVLMELILSR